MSVRDGDCIEVLNSESSDYDNEPGPSHGRRYSAPVANEARSSSTSDASSDHHNPSLVPILASAAPAIVPVVAPMPQSIDPKREPIIFRGRGHITMFGLNSRFDTDFPAPLTGRVAPEEIRATVSRVNGLVRTGVVSHARCLLAGLLCCCCTAGCSLWPALAISRRTISQIEKLLDCENATLYHKLGLHWRLARFIDNFFRLAEYVLLLQFLPRAPLMIPD